MIRTMIRTTKRIKDRTGIYVQESVGATTAGDGLGPRGYKSPVAQSYDNNNQNQELNKSRSKKPFNRKSSHLDPSIGRDIESDTHDERYKRMEHEFLKLGFQMHEIRAMKEALEDERKRRRSKKNKTHSYEINLGHETTEQNLEESKELEQQSTVSETASDNFNMDKLAGSRDDRSGAMKHSLEDEREKNFPQKSLTYGEEINLLLESSKANKGQVKFRAEKAEKTASGNFNPTKLVEQRDKDSSSGSHGRRECNVSETITQNQLSKLDEENDSSKIIFTSPAILAGAKENDCYCSVEKRREAAQLLKQMEFGRVKDFAEARQRMGLSGENKEHISSLDSLPEIQGVPGDNQNSETTKPNYPFEVQILNKPHPFGEIPEEVWFIMLDALETTIQDERATGANWLNITPGQYKHRRLHVNCKNIESVKWLKTKIHLYNRLWQGADLYLTNSLVSFKRSKYKVNIRNYHLTSEEFFKIIKKQNYFPTEYWTLYHKDRQNDRFKAFFSVDPESAKRLEESNGFVHFFFEKIQFIYQTD